MIVVLSDLCYSGNGPKIVASPATFAFKPFHPLILLPCEGRMGAMKTLATFAPKIFDVLNTVVILPFCLVSQFVILL